MSNTYCDFDCRLLSVSGKATKLRIRKAWLSKIAPPLDRKLIGWSVIGLLTTIIFSVAIFDVYWSFKTQTVIYETEQNPLGRWLIEMDGGDIALFMTAKMVGTMIAVSAIPVMYVFHRKFAWVIATSVATFQILLFLYLNYGNSIPIFAWL